METSSGWYMYHQAKMVRLRRQCCTLAFLFKSCIFLLAVSSVLLLLQSIWSSSSVEEKTGAGKSGRLTSNNINSGVFIEREYLPKEVMYAGFYAVEPSSYNNLGPKQLSCYIETLLYQGYKKEEEVLLGNFIL